MSYQTRVLIVRTHKVTITDQTEVLVISDERIEASEAERRAEGLIEAQLKCGHDVGWTTLKSEDEVYPRPTIEAGVIPPEPPPSHE